MSEGSKEYLNAIFSLEGKTALITGGGSGLGLAMAGAFVEAGAEVIITGRTEEKLQEACSGMGPGAHYEVNDVTDLKSLPGLVEAVEKRYGPIDVLVNNAGINLKKHATEVTDREFRDIIETDLTGLFALTREVSKRMVKRGEGSIINITSMAALYGISGVVAYSSAKTGLVGMTRTLAVDLSPHGVRVNAIAPGFIETPMLRKAMESDPERKRRVLERTPMRSFGQPDDIARAALFLASDAARFVTGVNLPVDGGNSIGF